EKFSKSLLHALPSSEVEHSSNVTLKCQSDVQNVTFVLGKLQDSGYKQECNSTGQDTKFLLTDLKPKDAGQYFCTYKTVAVEKWELNTEVIFVATFCCLCVLLLFIAVFVIYRCTRHGNHHAWLVATVFGISALHARLFSSKPEESQGVIYVKLNTNALSEAASVPTMEPPGSCDYATLKV
ncbi:hypothetical protein DBR06_SOUSAS44410020, partial [Sousa chinensis]